MQVIFNKVKFIVFVAVSIVSEITVAHMFSYISHRHCHISATITNIIITLTDCMFDWF
jgi:hypothetical protein